MAVCIRYSIHIVLRNVNKHPNANVDVDAEKNERKKLKKIAAERKWSQVVKWDKIAYGFFRTFLFTFSLLCSCVSACLSAYFISKQEFASYTHLRKRKKKMEYTFIG